MGELASLVAELDDVTTELLPALRSTKALDAGAMERLLDVSDGFRVLLGSSDLVPRHLVGKLWLVFTAMLTEAESSSDPEPLLTAASAYQDRLQGIFGPQL